MSVEEVLSEMQKGAASREAALRELDTARKRIPLKGVGKASEAAYSMAYQRLVKLGYYPQLRGKYRIR